MRIKLIPLYFLSILSTGLFEACRTSKITASKTYSVSKTRTINPTLISHNDPKSKIPARTINTKNISVDSIVTFAETLIGTRYKYGSLNKELGFDCSGFITYVFDHFKIKVPRTSIDFTNAGKTIEPIYSKKGDLILFTGTDTTGWIVGHMGIITENLNGNIKFLHAASGNNKGVMVSEMSNYFVTRFVKVIRIFY